jgi:hypothetical protein
MHTIETQHNNHMSEIPSSMEELTQDQYLFFIRMIALAKNDQLDFNGVVVRTFYYLMKIKRVRQCLYGKG